MKKVLSSRGKLAIYFVHIYIGEYAKKIFYPAGSQIGVFNCLKLGRG